MLIMVSIIQVHFVLFIRVRLVHVFLVRNIGQSSEHALSLVGDVSLHSHTEQNCLLRVAQRLVAIFDHLVILECNLLLPQLFAEWAYCFVHTPLLHNVKFFFIVRILLLIKRHFLSTSASLLQRFATCASN